MDRIPEALDIVRRAKALGDYDSNVVGMAAEIIAEDDLGMVKAPAGTKNIDGYIEKAGVKVSVQVKAFSSNRVLRYRGGAKFRIPEGGSDHLVVIIIYSSLAEYEILYSGDSRAAGKNENNKSTRIVQLSSIKSPEEIERILHKASEQNDT